MASLSDSLGDVLARFIDGSEETTPMSAMEVLWVKLMMPFFWVVKLEQQGSGPTTRTPIKKQFLGGLMPKTLPTIDDAFKKCIPFFYDLFRLNNPSKPSFKSIFDVSHTIYTQVAELDFLSLPQDRSQKIAIQALVYIWYKHYNTLQDPLKAKELDSKCEQVLQKLASLPHEISTCKYFAELSLARLYLTQAEKILGLPVPELSRHQEALNAKVEMIKLHLSEALSSRHPLAYILHTLYLRNMGHLPGVNSLLPTGTSDPIQQSDNYCLYAPLRKLLDIRRIAVESAAASASSTGEPAASGRKLDGLPSSNPSRPAAAAAAQADPPEGATTAHSAPTTKEPSFGNATLPSIPAPPQPPTRRPSGAESSAMSPCERLPPQVQIPFNADLFKKILITLPTLQSPERSMDDLRQLHKMFEDHTLSCVLELWGAPIDCSPQQKAALLAQFLAECKKFEPIREEPTSIPPKIARWIQNYKLVIQTRIESFLQERYQEHSPPAPLLSKAIETTLSWFNTLHRKAVESSPPPDIRSSHVFLGQQKTSTNISTPAPARY